MAQRLLLKIWDFFSSLSFSSVEPYGEWEEKKCSRGAGYLHIYSSGFISLPADSATWEHQIVGRTCLLFSATGFSEPEVRRSQGLLQVYGEITLSLRLKKYIYKDVGPLGFVEWAEVDHVHHKAEMRSTLGFHSRTFGRTWMTDMILDLPFFLCFCPSPPFTPRLHILHQTHKFHIINSYVYNFFWHAHAPCKCVWQFFTHVHMQSYVCVCVCIWACCCAHMRVWDWGAQAKVKSALSRLSGWMENIGISRDCSGICRRIWLALAAPLYNTLEHI